MFKYLMLDFILSGLRTDIFNSTELGVLDRWMTYEELHSSLLFMHFVYDMVDNIEIIYSKSHYIHVYDYSDDRIHSNCYAWTIYNTSIIDNERYMITLDLKTDEYLHGSV